MGVCKKELVEEYVIHVAEVADFYTSLRFSLLASSWFPWILGVVLWSLLNLLLVVYKAVLLLALFTIAFLFAASYDAFLVSILLCVLLLCTFYILAVYLLICIGVGIAWIWFLISCNCCQSLGCYSVTAGGLLAGPNPPPGPEQGGGSLPRPSPPQGPAQGGQGAAGLLSPWRVLWAGLNIDGRIAYTVKLVNHVKVVSFPYWRVNLGNLSREIVPCYDVVVIGIAMGRFDGNIVYRESSSTTVCRNVSYAPDRMALQP